MIAPFLPTHDATTVALDFGVFIAEHARTYRTSQTAIIAALLPIITPSQPGRTSSHAPAADTPAPLAGDTTGAEVLPSAAAPVEPIPPSPHAGDPADGAGIPPNRAPTPSAAFSPARGRPETTRAKVVACHHVNPSWPSKLIAQHLDISEDAVRATASRKGLKLVSWWDYQREQAKATAAALMASVQASPAQPQEPVERAGPPTPRSDPQSPPAATSTAAIEQPEPKRITLADKIRAHLVDNPEASLKEVTEAIGANMQAVGWAAQKAGITLRKRTAEERSAGSAKGAQAREASRALVTAPSQPIRIVTTHAPRGAGPSARFYVRDDRQRYLHQSLQASPTDDGPLMTINRHYAWFDNEQRFRGAAKVWPEIATMRKEGPNNA